MRARGTRARIATVSQGGRFFDTVEANRAYIFDRLNIALGHNPDLVCLPENFTTVCVKNRQPETVPGETIDAIAEKAREHHCYIVCPLLITRDAEGGCDVRNAAVVVGRSGEVVGVYEKRRPVTSSYDYTVFERGVAPGSGDGIFDLDFGRIGVRICFDVGFPEDWSALESSGVKLVLWPSAYDGGAMLNAYALLHRFWVITSVRSERSRIIDPCGVMLDHTDQRVGIAVRDINLDFAVCHYDFNWSIPDRIQADYGERVEIRSDWDAGLFLVEPLDSSLRVADLMAKYGFESADRYHERHRLAYGAMASGQSPEPQKAQHGDRSVYEER